MSEKKLVMPKGDGTLKVVDFSLEIYYKYKDQWLKNEIYKEEIYNKLGFTEEKDGPFLIKKSEIAKYFGMIEYNSKKREGKITDRGKRYHFAKNNEEKIDLVFEALENDIFGRNNDAVPSSNSDVDAPKLFIKSIYELTYVTKEEFAYILYYSHDLNWNFEDIIKEIFDVRTKIKPNYSLSISEENINKYSDVKFIVYFTNLGIVIYDDKKYYMDDDIYINYNEIIESLDVYNTEPEENISGNTYTEPKKDTKSKVNTNVSTYIAGSKALDMQNNRKPQLGKDTNNNPKYKVNDRIKKTAIEMNNYKCEISANHRTFINKSGNYYMEGHHFIPMSAQKDYKDINLDRIDNIAVLCPNCHRAIHYGNNDERLKILTELYKMKIDKLREVGINIELDELFNLYYK